jgi:hypothetical protein
MLNLLLILQNKVEEFSIKMILIEEKYTYALFLAYSLDICTNSYDGQYQFNILVSKHIDSL